MTWLRRRAEVVEVVRTDPGKTRSGTCALCETLDGEPVAEVGRPPYHPNCACKTTRVQHTPQPAEILDDEFEVEIPPTAKPAPDPGGVTDLDDELLLEDEL